MEEQLPAYEMGQAIGGILGCLAVLIIPTLFVVALILAIVRKSTVWTVVCVISGVLSLGLLGLGGYGVYVASKEAKIPKELVCDDGLVAITTPSGWSKLGLLMDDVDASIKIGNLLREEYLLVLSEPKTDFGSSFGAKAYADLVSQNTLSLMKDGELSEYTPMTIDGCQALQCEVVGEIDGIRIHYLNTYVDGANHFHQIITWTLPSKKEKAFPIFRDVVASFREVGDGSANEKAVEESAQ